jgi:type IV pilus assembly protein PilX
MEDRVPAAPARRDEAGMALVIAILLLLLVSAIGVAAIDRSGSESSQAGRGRRNAITFYAADAGIQYGRAQVMESPPRLDSFQVTLLDGTQFRSGPRAGAGAADLPVPDTGPPPDGFAINVGSGTGFVDEAHRFSVTGVAPDGTEQELETKVAQVKGGFGAY